MDDGLVRLSRHLRASALQWGEIEKGQQVYATPIAAAAGDDRGEAFVFGFRLDVPNPLRFDGDRYVVTIVERQ